MPILQQIQHDLATFRRETDRNFYEVRHDIRMLRAAVNDIARENVTPGEIQALHHDVTRLMGQQQELAARLDALEARQ